MRRCTLDAYCQPLEDRLEPDANARRKGFVVMVLMNMTTGDTRKVGVAYKTSAKDPGLMLNVCPFCGAEIDAGFKNQPVSGDTA
jgi:hypothetical protein